MKKLFTILFAGLLTFGLSAQTDAGQMMIGTSSNLSWSSVKAEGADNATSSLDLSLHYGYFVIDNLSVMATFSTSSSTNDGTKLSGNTAFGLASRYYFNSIFAHVGWNSSNDADLEVAGVTVETPAVSTIQFGAGYSYMMTDNLSLEPSFTYMMSSSDGEAVSSGMQIRVGLGLYL